MQTSITSYERETLNLRLNKINTQERNDNNNISFRDNGNNSFKTPEQPNRQQYTPQLDYSTYGDSSVMVA